MSEISSPSDGPVNELALVLTGGGARAAYQVGVLRGIARHLPQVRIPIITGVSAGAINSTFVASHPGTLDEALDELAVVWSELTIDRVFRVNGSALAKSAMRWAVRLASGGSTMAREVRALVDTTPLDHLLRRVLKTVDGEVSGIAANIDRGWLKAVALTAVNYATNQTVTWIQGRDLEVWERPHRRSVKTRLAVAHVMASSALPLFFPAIRIGNAWYGDGGIRLSAPLSPALHLGASRILAISTRYTRSQEEADLPTIAGYPPPAQIIGNLLNAVFLDVLDQDVLRAQRINELLAKLSPEERGDMRLVDVLVLRPSQDLGRLSAEFEPALPRGFRFLTRGLGTRETASPDFLSLLMFQPEYLKRLIEIGERDAEAHLPDLKQLCCPVDSGEGDGHRARSA